MMWDTEMTVNLQEVNEFIESDKFIRFLLNNTTDFAVAAFVLQTVKDKVNELKNNEESE